MLRIAHRGNITGPDPAKENDPEYIKAALDGGFHVEVDAWLSDGSFFLGHDEPTHAVDRFFFRDSRVWTHCKNIEAFLALSFLPDANCFWQESDAVTLTSSGFLDLAPLR